MIREDYTRIIGILKNAYPAIKWSPAQHDWLWRKVKDESAADLADAVDDLIGWRSTPPPPNAILKAIQEVKTRPRPRDDVPARDVLPPLDQCRLPSAEDFERWGKNIAASDPKYNHANAMAILRPVVEAARKRDNEA